MAQTLKFGNKTWATKKGSTLAYNDENGNYKPLPFAFTRSTSATRVNKEGLIEVVTNDRPRIDYTDTSDGVLLLENAATNLITYSEDFSQSYWSKSNLTLLSNNIISPDGTLNSSKLTVTSTGALLESSQSLSVGTVYTISAFVKKGTNKFVRLAYSSSSQTGAWFNLEDKTVGTVNSTSATINDYGNGWYRITNTLTSQVSSGGVFLGLSNTDGATGDSVSGNTVYVYGFQIEQNSVASSYIPTQGSAVTRAVDSCLDSGNSEVFNDSEGVLFVNIKTFFNDLLSRPISVSDGTTSNRINLFYPSNQTQVYGRITSGGTTTADMIFSGIIQTLYNKIAVKYKVNDFALWVNGFEVVTDSSGAVPTGLKELNLDNSGGTKFLGKTKEIGYYDAILTDLELETLTSYRSWESMVNELNLNIIYNG